MSKIRVIIEVPGSTGITTNVLRYHVQKALRHYVFGEGDRLSHNLSNALKDPSNIRDEDMHTRDDDRVHKQWTPMQELFHEVAHLKEQMERILLERVKKLERELENYVVEQDNMEQRRTESVQVKADLLGTQLSSLYERVQKLEEQGKAHIKIMMKNPETYEIIKKIIHEGWEE